MIAKKIFITIILTVLASSVVFSQENCEPNKRNLFKVEQKDKPNIKERVKTFENFIYNIFEIVRKDETQNSTTYYNVFNQTLTYKENIFGHWVWSVGDKE